MVLTQVYIRVYWSSKRFQQPSISFIAAMLVMKNKVLFFCLNQLKSIFCIPKTLVHLRLRYNVFLTPTIFFQSRDPPKMLFRLSLFLLQLMTFFETPFNWSKVDMFIPKSMFLL